MTDKQAKPPRGQMHPLVHRIAELEADNARLRAALELADAALRGANMDMTVVERKVAAALEGQAND